MSTTPHDAFFKYVFGRPENAAGEFRSQLPPELVEAIDWSALEPDEEALLGVIEGILEAWPEKVAEYRAGRGNLIGMFVGELMKATRGAADPKAGKELLMRRLDG